MTKRDQIESAISLWTANGASSPAALANAIFSILHDPSDAMLEAGNQAALGTTVLLDDSRFACERATWTSMLESARTDPA